MMILCKKCNKIIERRGVNITYEYCPVCHQSMLNRVHVELLDSRALIEEAKNRDSN